MTLRTYPRLVDSKLIIYHKYAIRLVVRAHVATAWAWNSSGIVAETGIKAETSDYIPSHSICGM